MKRLISNKMNRYVILILCFTVCIIWLYHVSVLNDYFENWRIKDEERLGTTDYYEFTPPQRREFIPTNEWQTIDKDQAVPRGVHVRINLTTGQREAKLLDSKSSKNNEIKEQKEALSIVPDQKQKVDESLTGENGVKANLQNIKNEMKEDSKKETVQGRFRTYEDLKDDLASLNLNLKTDMEVLQGLFKKYNTIKDVKKQEEEVLNILRDFESLVDQVDNGLKFAELGGMSEVVLPCLLVNSSKIRQEAALLLGSAVQNSPKVQVIAFEADVLYPLLRMITIEKDSELRSKSIFALSCLIRMFPHAQQKFVEYGGISTLISLCRESSSDLQRPQLKVVTLLSDLAVEHADAKFTAMEPSEEVSSTTTIKEKLKQYNEIDIENKLKEEGWCETLSKLITEHTLSDFSLSNSSPNSKLDTEIDHDFVDKLTTAISIFSDSCENTFKKDNRFLSSLTKLNNYYTDEITENVDSPYNTIYKTVNDLCYKLHLI